MLHKLWHDRIVYYGLKNSWNHSKPDLSPQNSWHNIRIHSFLLGELNHKYHCIWSYTDQCKDHKLRCTRLDCCYNSCLFDKDYVDLSDNQIDSFDFVWEWHLFASLAFSVYLTFWRIIILQLIPFWVEYCKKSDV